MKKLAFIASFFVLLPSLSLAESNLLSALSLKLKYLNERQSVLSQNIANADTPGYKARDLEQLRPRKSSTGVKSIQLMATAPGHIATIGSPSHFKTIKQKSAYDTSLDGNNVVLEEQMTKMAQNDLEYNKTLGVLRQFNGLVRSAIGRQQ